jgi:hypothetical protein
MTSNDVDPDILDLIDERVDNATDADDEPVDAFMMRLGQVQWVQDLSRTERGYWMASAGWADKELDGLTFEDRDEARRRTKQYVALLVQGRVKDFFFR